jgi:hypothetical protein
MGFSISISNFFRKYISRKFLVSTIVAPSIIQYALNHDWPPELINHLLLLMGVGITGIAAVDTVNANRGLKPEN